MSTLRPLTCSTLENLRLFVSVFSLFLNFSIKSFEIVFGESVIGEESLNLIVNEFGKSGVVSILEFELVGKQAFELLSLLDLHESFSSGFAHLGRAL